MPTRCHNKLADGPAERLAGDRQAVSEATAMLVVLLATAAILALAGLAIVGVLNAIAWLVAQ